MNYRLPTVVETMIWLIAASMALFMAIGVTLLMAIVGAIALVTRMATEAVRSCFHGTKGAGAIHRQNSREQGVRPTIIDGQVLGRS